MNSKRAIKPRISRAIHISIFFILFSLYLQIDMAAAQTPTNAETTAWIAKTINRMDRVEYIYYRDGKPREEPSKWSYSSWVDSGILYVVRNKGKRRLGAIHARSIESYNIECYDRPNRKRVPQTCDLYIYSTDGEVFERSYEYSSDLKKNESGFHVPVWINKVEDWIIEGSFNTEYWRRNLRITFMMERDMETIERITNALDHLIEINGNAEPF